MSSESMSDVFPDPRTTPLENASASSRLGDVTVQPLPDGQGDDQQPDSLLARLREPRTIISFLIAIAIVIFAFTRLDLDFNEVWRQMKAANPLLIVAAGVMYYGSLLARGMRWKAMLARVDIDDAHGYPMPGPFGMFQIIFFSWFANSVVPARLGDAYRSYLLKQKTKASFGASLGTILAERLIDLVVLVLVLLGSGIIVFGTKVPHRAEQAFLIGAAVVVVGVIGTIVLWIGRDFFVKLLPDRIAAHYANLHAGIFEVLRRPFSFGAISIGLWLMDGIRLLLVAYSLDQHLTLQEATMVAGLSALATIVPVTPAGLGVVESFAVWILTQVDVGKDTAGAIALLDRFVTYFSLVLIGIPAYLWMMRRVVKSDDDATTSR